MAGLPQIQSIKTPDKMVVNATRPRRFSRVPLPFLIVIALLVAYGLLICYAAVQNDPDYSFSRQALGVAVGIVFMLGIWHVDYQRFANMSTILLVINVVLILSPHIPGLGTDAGMGAQSWINVGMQIQPGEFAKVTVVLFVASIMAKYHGKLDDPREYCKVLALMLIPFLCIMTQPDLGTGLVYLFISAVGLIMGGARPKYLVITLIAGICAIVAVFIVDEFLKYETSPGVYEYRLLKNYQRNRLLVFLNQGENLSDEGYNLQQAQIAIGSGGLFGKGLFNTSQSALGYLPEAPTDFVFCVLAEGLGFFGALVLLGLYAALILISVRIARSSNDLFGMLIVLCVVGMWLFQILENIGMDCGLMPITGIPLPFVSYGSSFMLVNFMMLGLIASVWHHSVSGGKKGSYANTH